MKKLLLILLTCTAIHASAQYNTPVAKAFEAGVDFGIPSNSIYTIGLGASAKVEFPVANKVALTISAGYDIFFYKGNLFASSRTPSPAGFLPLKAGAKYYINPGVYFEGELGSVIETNYLRHDLLAFSIGPGFVVPINDKHGIDIGLRYESWSDHQLRQTAVKFAYRLGWQSR